LLSQIDFLLADAVVRPVSAQTVALVCHPDVMRAHFIGRRYDAAEQCSGIIRKDTCLLTPCAIFKGLKRSLHSIEIDNFVFAHVCGPSATYRFDPTKPGNGPDAVICPRNSVFVMSVSLARAIVGEAQRILLCPDGTFRAVILGWEWTQEAPGTHLPIDYRTRHTKEIWREP
jgi:hypothetical protein